MDGRGRPDKVRFHRPYVYTLEPETIVGAASSELIIHQAPFNAEGFASTVWDSSIVVAKHFERRGRVWALGRRCLDVSAGCGLVGAVLTRLGARVTATDLPQNLALLRRNTEACACPGVQPPEVIGHRWDVMYIEDAVEALVSTLEAVAGPHTEVYVAHGRNRQAEGTFLRLASSSFRLAAVPDSELHDVYQTVDVTVLRLTRQDQQEGSAYRFDD